MSHHDASNNRPVAFFDFDGTLTTGDTLMPFLKFVVGAPVYYAKLALVSPILATYFAKLLRNDTAKQIVLKHYLAGYHIDDLFERGQHFSEEVIPTLLRPKGMERLRWHQEQGHECILVSASIDIYLNAWAQRVGIDAVLCSSLEKDDLSSIVSGKIKGRNCYGEEKLHRIKSFMIGKQESATYAYGDTSGDLPMLYYADYGAILKKNKWVSL